MKLAAMLGFIAAAGALIAPCYGQALADVREIRIIIEQLNNESMECGVREDDLEAAARIVLSTSKLRVGKDVLSPFLYVQVTVIREGNQCIGSLNMAVNRLVMSSPSRDPFFARVWNSSQVMAFTRNDFSRRLSLAVEADTKRMLGTWLKEN